MTQRLVASWSIIDAKSSHPLAHTGSVCRYKPHLQRSTIRLLLILPQTSCPLQNVQSARFLTKLLTRYVHYQPIGDTSVRETRQPTVIPQIAHSVQLFPVSHSAHSPKRKKGCPRRSACKWWTITFDKIADGRNQSREEKPAIISEPKAKVSAYTVKRREYRKGSRRTKT